MKRRLPRCRTRSRGCCGRPDAAGEPKGPFMSRTRKTIGCAALFCSVALVGCQNLFRVSNRESSAGPVSFRAPDSANELVAHLNRTSMPIQAVECGDVKINITHNG